VVCAVIYEPVSTENSRLLGNLVGNFDFLRRLPTIGRTKYHV
jgi:hypothetical protein